MNRCSLYANIKISSSVTQTLLSTEIERIFNHLSRFFSKKSYSKGVTRRSPISNLKEIHLSTCFSSKNAGVTVAILTIYSRIWMTASIGGGVASKRDGRTERKTSRRRRRRRERDTHTHTHARTMTIVMTI